MISMEFQVKKINFLQNCYSENYIKERLQHLKRDTAPLSGKLSLKPFIEDKLKLILLGMNSSINSSSLDCISQLSLIVQSINNSSDKSGSHQSSPNEHSANLLLRSQTTHSTSSHYSSF